MGMPMKVSRGGWASCLKLDSARMMASWTCTGVPQRFSVARVASYQSGFSANRAQASSTWLGGVVAQPGQAEQGDAEGPGSAGIGGCGALAVSDGVGSGAVMGPGYRCDPQWPLELWALGP